MRNYLAISILVGLPLAACTTQAEPEAEQAPTEIAIAGNDIFPESMDADSAGNIYVGSMDGTIYRAEAGTAEATPWIVPNEANGLQSLFGVLVDEGRGLLWTCSNPPFGGPPNPDAGPAAVKTFALETGELAESWDFPADRPATCNDIAIQADGTAFATDISGGRLFMIADGAEAMELFADGEDLVGADGIAFADDGTMYINNVQQNLVQRVDRAEDGSYAGLTTLTLTQEVAGPDALRPVGGNTFLQAEGGNGRIALVEIDGDNATVTTVADQFESVASVARVGSTGYSAEGKINYRFDPSLADQDPNPFVIESFPLPEGL